MIMKKPASKSIRKVKKTNEQRGQICFIQVVFRFVDDFENSSPYCKVHSLSTIFVLLSAPFYE